MYVILYAEGEQRELYEAAKVIQTAFRQYKARLTNIRQLELERRAAVVIQSYYRRYKQARAHASSAYTIQGVSRCTLSVCNALIHWPILLNFSAVMVNSLA